jgi:hypothetical protein
LAPLAAVQPTLREQGFAVIGAEDTCKLLGVSASQLRSSPPIGQTCHLTIF